MLEAWANCCLAHPGYIYRALVTFVGVTAFIAAPAAGGAVRWRSVESKPVPVMSSAQAGQVLRGLVADRGLRHVVVHFSEPAGPRIHRRLEHAGVKLLAYLGDNAFFAAVSESRLRLGRLARVESLVSAQAIERNFKLHPFFVADTIPDYALVGETPNPVTGVREGVVAAYILFHRDVSLKNGIAVVQQLGAVIRNRLESVNGLVIELPRSALGPLADRDEVFRGRVISGEIGDLFDSDDSRMGFWPGITEDSSEAPVWLLLTGTSLTDMPAELRFTLEANVNTPGVAQRIELFNYVAQSYGEIDFRVGTDTDSILEIVVDGDPSRFVDSKTLEMKAQLTWPPGPLVFFPWTVSVDQAVWKVVP